LFAVGFVANLNFFVVALQTSLSSFKSSPLNGSGQHISSDINMPMPGTAVVAPGTPNLTNAKVSRLVDGRKLRHFFNLLGNSRMDRVG
jgi:hypothetical protein